MKDQTTPLVELHGQHEHQTLLDPQSHLRCSTISRRSQPDRDVVAAAFLEWRRLQSGFDSFQMDEREKAARLDLLSFQMAELEKANLRAGEDEELETSRRVLAQCRQTAAPVQRGLRRAVRQRRRGARAVSARFGSGWGSWPTVDPVFQSHLDARDAIKSQLEDLALTLRGVWRKHRCVTGAAAGG